MNSYDYAIQALADKAQELLDTGLDLGSHEAMTLWQVSQKKFYWEDTQKIWDFLYSYDA
jgi:hypothetical protein